MYNLDNLKESLKRRREAQKAYFDHTLTGDDLADAQRLDTLRRSYDDAAHSVAFHADILVEALEVSTSHADLFAPLKLDMIRLTQPPSVQDTSAEDDEWKAHNAALRLDAYPAYHAGFKRVIESIEQHDPLLDQPITEPDLEHWLAIGRDPSEFYAEVIECDDADNVVHVLSSEPIEETLPDYLTDDAAFEAVMNEAFWQHNNAMAQAKCVLNDPECPNTGWPLPCVKCNYCSQNPDELEPIVDDEGPGEWLEPATDEDLAGQSSNSCDLFDEYDDDDYDSDWDDGDIEQSISRWAVKAANGQIAVGRGILTRYPGEDWGEASGWAEDHYNLNELNPAFKRSVLKFMKDKAPGQYDLPSLWDEDEED